MKDLHLKMPQIILTHFFQCKLPLDIQSRCLGVTETMDRFLKPVFLQDVTVICGLQSKPAANLECVSHMWQNSALCAASLNTLLNVAIVICTPSSL